MNGMITSTIKALSNIHIQGKSKNIVILSTPRSGSTWVMELIASQPGFKFYDEPLNVRRANVARAGYFQSWDDLMPDSGNDDRIIDYLRRLQDNRLGVMNPPPFRRNYRPLTRRIVFKIHELEHLMGRIRESLDVHMLYLLRHPIATTVSRNELPRVQAFFKSTFFKNLLSAGQLQEIEAILARGSRFEQGILSWCYQNLVPLNHTDRSEWLTITYEELVLNPACAWKIACERLELTDLQRILKQVEVPATNIVLSGTDTIRIMEGSEGNARSRKLITKWKDKVGDAEEARAFQILSLFNIDAYAPGRYLAAGKYLHCGDTNAMLPGNGPRAAR